MFEDVPSISVPDANSVYHPFTDVSDTTATAADVAQGKYFYASDGTRTVGSYTPQSSTLVTKSITANGTYDATDDSADGYSEVTVNVQPSLQAKTNISPTTSSQTIQPDNGYYGLSRVQINAMPSGTAGTPTATKGTVSNHSVSVTPSVTNTTGYITGSTKTGTAVTVSASELVSGTKSITANGTGIDVTNYSAVDVAVSGGSSDLKKVIDRTITSLTLPNDQTTIGAYAFANCQNLTTSSLPSGVTKIEEYAFYVCAKLALTSLPSGVTKIGNYAFFGCTNLALTSLPSGVTSIPTYAFYNCKALPLTALPSGVTSISSYAFYGCTNLALTALPSGVTAIYSNVFENCTSLALTSIPSGVTVISSSAFSGCTGLETITCAGQISTLSSGAFSKCSSLTRAEFPNCKVSSFTYAFGSSTAANACQNLETIDIGNSSAIASNAFANCYKLQTLVLRKSASICTLANISAFLNTPMHGYNGLTGTVYVPSALISNYQTANNWKTLYNNGTLTFAAIEGSQYEL